jgi:cation:H+ antiporter
MRDVPGLGRRVRTIVSDPPAREPRMLATFVLFGLSAAAIYFACEYFVNGVEWLGRRLVLGATATGTVLAAFGTALPESAVTFVAVVFGRDAAHKDIGVGAAIGGPLVLATIAYAVVGMALWSNRARLGRGASLAVRVDHRRLARDQSWFLAIFAFKIGLGLVAFAFKPWLGLLFVGAYGLYVWKELRDDEATDADEILEPLKLRPREAEPALAWIVLQGVIALSVIGVAARVFVGQIEGLGRMSGLSPHIIALLLSPVATELPEIMNALIWVRQGKERLALANISGSMMIQATIPSALAIGFTPWLLDASLLLAAAATALAVIVLWSMFRRGVVGARALLPVGGLYVVFVLGAAWLWR